MNKNPTTLALTAAICLLVAPHARAVGFGQVDTFQDGTAMNWTEGGSSPNPPTNIEDGGPAGDGDAFLQDESTGGFGAGSKLIMFNTSQWLGDYVTAGVDRITFHMANQGKNPVNMRIGIRGGPTSTVYGSTVAAVLPPDGLWRVINFDLNTSSLTSVSGGDTLAQVLGGVVEFRLLSALGGPTFTGDPIAATLGVDNITAHDIAGAIFRVSALGFVSDVPKISFTTISGRNHRVEHADQLINPTWVPVTNASNVPGTGGIVQVDDPDPGARNQVKRFYRVVLLPP